MTFASFGLPTSILKGIRAAGFTEPTAIQSRAIPIILDGNDLIGAAQSGSGKTGAYVIPILARLVDNTTTRLRALVLAPARDLAQYVETRIRDYARFTNVKVGVVFTGGPIQAQERMLRETELDVLVATPGRLLDLQARGVLNFEDVEVLVLEEADRMVALGLAPDLRKLLKLLPETRQTLMWAMSMPPELNRLTKEALIEPVRVDMAPPPKAAPGITQAIYPVSKALKFDLLDEMMSRTEVRSTILFCRHRAGCERVARALQKRGYSVSILDEHPSQGEREARLEDLRRGRSQILCASDAAARSLDVTGVSHVVNVDVPQTPEDYVHRLGRTGRQDPVGDVFTLMSPEEQREVAAIERLLGRAILRVVLPDFDYQMQPREFQQVVSYDEATREQTRRPGGLQNAATRISVVPRGSSTTSGNGRPTAAVALPVQKAGGSSASKSARPSHQAKRPKASTTRKRSAAKPARRSRTGSAGPKAKRSTARRGHGAAKRR